MKRIIKRVLMLGIMVVLLGSFIYCGGGGDGSTGGGGGGDATAQAESYVSALKQPGYSRAVDFFTDNCNLPVVAQTLYPEVQSLINLKSDSTAALLKVLSDPTLDGTEDGDRIRALVAYILEDTRAYSAVEPLANYLRRAFTEIQPIPFISIQAGMHAWAVLTGHDDLIRGLYDYDTVAAFVAGSHPSLQSEVLKHTLPTSNNQADIGHTHIIVDLPVLPKNYYQTDFTPEKKAALDNVFYLKQDKIAPFQDPIKVLESSSRSYCCHSWTFRPQDTTLPDLYQRYHISGDQVDKILANEGYINITAYPQRWREGDVILFRRFDPTTNIDLPRHTGRISSLGPSSAYPDFRFTSKWSMFHPVVDVSVRDALRVYPGSVEVWTNRLGGQCDNISGVWQVAQTTTLTCTNWETGGEESLYEEASGEIAVTQDVCNVSDSNGDLTGTIDGVHCNFLLKASLQSFDLATTLVYVKVKGDIDFDSISLTGSDTVLDPKMSCLVQVNALLLRGPN
jgi:hypothetical protein